MLQADAAHDLKIAVQTILACAQMIEQEAGDGAHRIGEYARILEESARGAARLLGDALDESCAAHFTLQAAPGDAIRLLARTVRRFEPFALQAGIILSFEAGVPSARFPFDADKLDRIAANLLSNALRYARSRVIVRARLSGETFTLKVADDGAGFSVDPFSQACRGEEHGIGLAEAQRFARLHGGDLCACRREGLTIFSAILPLCPFSGCTRAR